MDYICRQPNFFKNPNKLPLNELQLEVKIVKRNKKLPADKNIDDVKDSLNKNYDVRLEKKLALDPYWIQKERSYCKYQPYYSEVSKDENELYISKNKTFKENLNFLLQCTYHQFWNYVIFEPRIKAILKSFIFNAVQIYELKHLDGEYLDLYNEIYKKVANIYLRILTFKESNVEFMSADTVMKLLEKHKLFSFPEITNILMLYSNTNQKLILKIQELFLNDKHKSKYSKELNKIFDHFLIIFEMVAGKICGFEEDAVIMPVGIRPRPPVYDPYWIEEVVTYLLDTATVLNSLLANCPPAIETAINFGLSHRLTDFYNRVYPALYEMMHDRAVTLINWSDLKTRILDHIAMGRHEFVDAFHVIITHLIDEIIQSLGDNENQDAFTEKYLSIISSALEDEFFIFDYHNTHSIDLQIQTLSDFHPQIDHMRINYILESLSTLPTLEKLREIKLEAKSEAYVTPKMEPCSSSQENGFVETKSDVRRTYSESEILELTKSIMDTLPHFGDGFIRECLRSYNYNTPEVISAILDDNLPPHLSRLPRDLLYVPPEPEPDQPLLSYRGKKPDYKDAGQLLNDKSDIEEVKNFVLKVSNVSYNMYDDEYDDRYDDEPQLKFYDKSDETSMYEHMGKRFEEYELVSDPSETYSEDDDEEPVAPAVSNPKAFCEDPAVVRARREANRGGGRGRSFNVVGKPKGQGQEKAVLHNRDKKNVQKSSRANHNRKSGAQWKRNKGMMPF